MRLRTIGGLLLVASVLGSSVLAAGSDAGKDKPRKIIWTSFFTQFWKKGEARQAVDAAIALAAEWKLESVTPAPGSAVQWAYGKGESVFQGTFIMTIMVDTGPRAGLLIEVALDPKSDQDEDDRERFVKELKKRLAKVVSAPVYTKTEKRKKEQ